ncbi:MAG: sulfur carrier protein ThiS [Phycisphaerae bacterium]|nr:sulfur carrier protein ThiS [Phycisphaerae bacterium]
MLVTVNGQSMELPDGEHVGDLLGRLGLERSICAVEVNRALVPKRLHSDTLLQQDDQIEVVTLVGGG